jgi:hypothetical protein
MEMAMKLEELNVEPRELTIDELNEAAGGFILAFAAGILVGAVVCAAAALITDWIRS